MPVDVAVEEPRARVVGDEPDGDLITCASANAYNVAHDWVDPVVIRAVRATDYVERMAVQVDGMRPSKSKRGDCELDTLVRFEAIDTARGKEVRGIHRSAQDLEQYRDTWGCKGLTINSELSRGECNIQVDVDVSASRRRCSRNTCRHQRVKIGFY